MHQHAFEDFFNDEGYEFYKLRVKRSNWLYFQFFTVWTMWINAGRVKLQSVFALEFGIFLDSNLVSRIMADLFLSLAPKSRVKSLKMGVSGVNSSRDLILRPLAENNIPEFKQMEEETQSDLLETIHGMTSGEKLSEIQERNPSLRPFKKLRQLGSQLGEWMIRSKPDLMEVAGIAIDEKVIRKAFDLQKHPEYSSHWVSRVKTYLPSIYVEVAALLRPGRLAEVVGHFFPFPQKRYDTKGKHQPLQKDIYLMPFLKSLYQKFGSLVLLADANYATKKLISWLHSKGWHFIMRLSSKQKNILKSFQAEFDKNQDLDFIDKWVYGEEFGGFIRILAYRRVWKDKKGTRKEKRFFTVTTLDWAARDIYKMYRLRWTLENTFKTLPVLDQTPGMNPELFKGFFALTLHILAPVCFQTRSSSRTLSKLLNLPMEVEKNKIEWQNIPTRFARKLLLFGYYRSMDLHSIELVV